MSMRDDIYAPPCRLFNPSIPLTDRRTRHPPATPSHFSVSSNPTPCIIKFPMPMLLYYDRPIHYYNVYNTTTTTHVIPKTHRRPPFHTPHAGVSTHPHSYVRGCSNMRARQTTWPAIFNDRILILMIEERMKWIYTTTTTTNHERIAALQ